MLNGIDATDKVKLYRSIGDSELMALLIDGHVHGRYNNSYEAQNNSNLEKVCACFIKPYRWFDKKHKYFIEIEIERIRVLEFGKGLYYASKKFGQTKIWTGRIGKTEYWLEEAYISLYCISDVKSIKGLSKFSEKYLKDEIDPILDQYGIKRV